MERLQFLVRQPQSCCCAGSQVLHQHVGILEQACKHLGSQFVLQVKGQALLGAIGPYEVGSKTLDATVVCACKVTHIWSFDLDHASAQVGELPSAERRRNRVLERDDGDAL